MKKDDIYIAMYHGQLDYGRGLERIIEVVARDNRLNLVLLGFGNEEYIGSLKKRCDDLKISQRVLFYNAVPQNELWKYIGAADFEFIIIEPISKSYFYCLPNKLFESIQSAVPVIVSPLPELKKIVDVYRIGEYTDSLSIDDIYKPVRNILDSPELLLSYKQNLYNAREELNWETESRIMFNEYGKLTAYKDGIKAVKLVPNTFRTASRDKREVAVMRELGWNVSIALPEQEDEEHESGYQYIELKHKKVLPSQNSLLRKMLILRNEWLLVSQIRKISADVISCHDLAMLRRAWFAFVGKKRPILIYDSHEFEIERSTNNARSRFRRRLVILEERFLMKKCNLSVMVCDSIAEEVARVHKLKDKPIVVRNIPNKYYLDEAEVQSIRAEFVHRFSNN